MCCSNFCMSHMQKHRHTIVWTTLSRTSAWQTVYLHSHRPNLLRALKIMIVSPCHAKAGIPFSIIKDVGFLNSGFLSCNATHFVSMSPGLLHINMCVNCGLETRSTKGWYYGYCYFESTVLSFCHHPWAMSGEPTDKIKISDPSQF